MNGKDVKSENGTRKMRENTESNFPHTNHMSCNIVVRILSFLNRHVIDQPDFAIENRCRQH